MTVEFVHLHNHSEYSLYDGFQSPEEMAKRAKELGYSAIALTDHGQVGGLFKFQKACKKEGIKPILGCEIYMCEDLADKKAKRYHLILLAKNNIGLKNLFKICTIGNKNKASNFPRITFDILQAHKEGLIISTACIGGEFAQNIIRGDIRKAYQFAEKYKDVWGEDFYLEVMWTGIPEQKDVLKQALECGRKLGIKVIATNDCHYLTKDDAKYQQIKKSINVGKPLERPDHPNYYIKSFDEMKKMFRGQDGEELLKNTLEIAEKCNAEIEVGKVNLPDFKIKYDEEFEEFKKTQWRKSDIQSFLIFNARKGLKKLGLDTNKVYADRLEEELETIQFTSFDSYFLIVEDYINFAKSTVDPFTGKEKKTCRVGLGRGSGCGSLVLFCLGVTGIDPLKHDLSMDRFLYSEAEYRVGKNEVFEDCERKEFECLGTGNRSRKISGAEETRRKRLFEHVRSCNSATQITEEQKTRIKDELNFVREKITLIDDILALIDEGRVGTLNEPNSFLLEFLKLTSKKADLSKDYAFLYKIDKNQSRVSPPDIDVDFEERTTLENYLCNLYGTDCVAFISTTSNYKAKAAIQHAAKAIDITGTNKIEEKKFSTENTQEAIRISKIMLQLPLTIKQWLGEDDQCEAKNKKIKEAMELLAQEKIKYPELFEVAQKLEGRIKSFGTHPAGIVISSRPIVEDIPMFYAKVIKDSESGYDFGDDLESSDLMTTQFDMKEVEEIGLLKFDFLQIENLRQITLAMELIKEKCGKPDFDIDNLEYNDPNVFKTINDMKLEGLFQINGDTFAGREFPLFDKTTGEPLINDKGKNKGKQKVFKVKGVTEIIGCNAFEDIAAMNAIGRPGPLAMGVPEAYAQGKKDPSSIQYLHPKLKPILEETYSQLIYQEQLIKMSMAMAGFTFAEADKLRKACAKKDKSLLDSIGQKFIAGCKKNGIEQRVIDELYRTIVEFGEYAFNKAHCLAGDTLVYDKRTNTLTKVEELYPGARIDSYLDGKIVEDEVVQLFRTGRQEIAEIELETGMKIKCTEKHKFLCADEIYRTVVEIIKDRHEIITQVHNHPDYRKKSKISRIKFLGIEPTFNIMMKSDQHNYVITDTMSNTCISKNSVAYGAICYQTAFLKTYYTTEFLCTLLTSAVQKDTEKRNKITSRIKKEYPELKIVGPDINLSKSYYAPIGEMQIVSPFVSLSGIGQKVSDEILQKRNSVKTFKSVDHFLSTVNSGGKNVVSIGLMDLFIDNKVLKESEFGTKDKMKTEAKRYFSIKNMVVKKSKFQSNSESNLLF